MPPFHSSPVFSRVALAALFIAASCDACRGLCSLLDPLHVQDGHLAIGDESLTLPPEFSDPRELANAKTCAVR